MDKKRRTAIQGIAALLQNAHFVGFFTGKLYQGGGKNICVPGLNCYSCPGAVGACPIGSLQNSLSAYRFRFPYYVLGLLIFFGALLGRLICGFLCPFGLLQDLLHRIPFPKKVRTFRGDRMLRRLKYIVLLVMVVILPACIKLTPVFCKYLCPSGTLSGVLLSLADHRLVSQFGAIFTWKAIILLAIVLLTIMISRPFCRYICPLGAFYGLFNRFSVAQLQVDHTQCTDCGACGESCTMCIDPVKEISSAECIRCGACAHACPVHAIHWTTPFACRMRKEEQHGDP